MALCLEFEILRLRALITTIGAPSLSIANRIFETFSVSERPVRPSTFQIQEIAEAFGGGTFDDAITAVPQDSRKIVESYLRYAAAARNLNYRLDNNTFGDDNRVITIADFPFVASAMQDTRQRLASGLLEHRIYTRTDGAVLIGELNDSVLAFSLAQLNEHLAALYNLALDTANRAPLPYTLAATELAQTFGPYCVFCEANLKTQIDVEHSLPKGTGTVLGGIPQGFSTLSNSWQNLLPVCPRCNAAKTENPSKLEITTAATTTNFTKRDQVNITVQVATAGGGDPRINDLEYQELFPAFYQFPTEPASYANVGFALWNTGTDAVDNTAITAQINWSIARVNEAEKHVLVNIPGNGMRQYRLLVDTGTLGASRVQTPTNARPKVANIIQICGLNNVNDSSDRRLLERTETWFLALAAIREISTALDALPDDTGNHIYQLLYSNWKTNLAKTIKEKGFFSVWLKVLNAFPHPLAGRDNLAPRFPTPLPDIHVAGAVAGAVITLAQDIATALQASGYFPNTNFEMVP